MEKAVYNIPRSLGMTGPGMHKKNPYKRGRGEN